MDVSTKLKELRKKAGLTQQEVAGEFDEESVSDGDVVNVPSEVKERWPHARSCDPEARLVDLCESHFNKEWTRALEASGLRRVPPGTLRHTSDTIALDSGVAPDLVDKMHGRTEHSSTYRNYYRPALSAMEQAARRVGETLR